MNKFYQLTEDDVILQKTSISFDVSMYELFLWFFSGGSLCVLPEGAEKDPMEIATTIKTSNVSIIHFVPSMFGVFLDVIKEDKHTKNKIESLRYIWVSGEELLLNHVNLFFETFHDMNVELSNLYGPTETTVDVTYFKCIKDELNKVIPIGKPIDNVRIYITNKSSELMPIGVPGELCVAGVCLAEGYLNKEELTKEKFIVPKYINEDRIYKTGDLAMWLPDGNIQFLGRIDKQVKIRGFRIEISEVENCLLNVNFIDKVAVIARKDKENIQELYAYYSKKKLGFNKKCKDDTVICIREIMSQTIPEYMIPSFFIEVDEIPMLSNGKIDRQRLPDLIDISEDLQGEINKDEIKIAEIWSEVLNITIHSLKSSSNYFRLGGNSLNIIKLLNKIHMNYNIKLPFDFIFKFPTIRDMNGALKDRVRSKFKEISRTKDKEKYSVTSLQKRLYIFQQINKTSIAYNVYLTKILKEEIDLNRLKIALQDLSNSQEILRTIFDSDDNIYQKVKFNIGLDISEFNILRYDEEKINEIIKEFIKPFDLKQGPLFRIAVIKIDKSKSILIIDMHHIITDAISVNIFLQELMLRYYGKDVSKLEIQFKDYAEWLTEKEQQESLNIQMEYWKNELKDYSTTLELPCDKIRPEFFNFRGNIVNFEIDAKNVQYLKRIAQRNSTTMFSLLLSVFKIMLYKLSNNKSLMVGIPSIYRPYEQLNKVIGNFLNVLPTKTNINDELKFDKYLSEVSTKVFLAMENQMYPFEEMINHSSIHIDSSRSSLVDVFFSYINKEENFDNTEICVLPYEHNNNTSKFDLSFYGIETKEEIKFSIEYYSEVFVRNTAFRFASYYKNIIRNIIDAEKHNQHLYLKDIEIINAEEKNVLLYNFNNTELDINEVGCVHKIIENQTGKYKDEIALSFNGSEITYNDLNNKSNQLARYLIKSEVNKGQVVGIFMNRSIEMVISMLAIMKVGAVFLPLDKTYPVDRLSYMIEDSGVNVLLVNTDDTNYFKSNILKLNVNSQQIANMDKSNVSIDVSLDDLVYIIYTSGSTGEPKGVMVKHKGLKNFMYGVTENIGFSRSKSILALTTITFDISILEIIIPLTKGMKIFIANEKEQLDPKLINNKIINNNIDIIQVVPSRLQLMSQDSKYFDALNSVKEILIGGEELKQSLFDTIASITNAKVYNMYGPTETTIWSTIKELNRNDKVNIGKPICNTKIYILDDTLKIVPIGMEGEIYIGGSGLTHGYVNKEEITKRNYIENPFIEGERIYKTEDHGRWLENGEIEFLGRRDNQVKIRGFRIELNEIEKRVLEYEGIKEVAVCVIEDNGGGKELGCYYISDTIISINKLKEYLSTKLPSYMIPKFIISIDKMPKTLNGKLDRKSLPLEYKKTNLNEPEYIGARSSLEQELIEIFEQTLNLDKISIKDNFFYLGGNSLLVVKLEMIIEQKGYNISAEDIYNYKTVEKLAEFIEKG